MPVSFKNFITVDYKPGEDELIKYRADKKKEEALTFSQRRQRSRAMKKNKAKLKMGRKRQMAKAADLPRLKKRAQKAARVQIFKKITKGKSRDEIPAARRQEIEKRLDKMKARIDRVAKKLLPSVRKKDQQRRSK